MQILVIGGGGREHALAWKLAQSHRVTQVFVAPGNAGTALEDKVTNIAIEATDLKALLNFAKTNHVAYTVVGPEAPLVAGIVNQFEANGLNCFGPNKECAQLEGSKAFAKAFLARHQIPTAAYETFTEVNAALTYLDQVGAPIVIKADGLAAGKGVILATTLNEAKNAVNDMLEGNQFGEAGHRVVIEEFLTGEEASFIVIVDGPDVLPLASSQDHKAAYDGDKGPNTGGMGAYSPAVLVDQACHNRIMTEVIRPTIDGLKKDGLRYRGFLYAGIMIAADGTPKVLEFNCRFGDPETQPILFHLKSDFLNLVEAACQGRLNDQKAIWDSRFALGVVMAAPGYPGHYPAGSVIEFGEDIECTKVFHAGTTMNEEKIITSGGRVLCVTALGETIKDAQKLAYERVKNISFKGAQYRSDIGYKAITKKPRILK
ncbi:phosphoribosylamine--glycine ligase [Litorivicinus sp.]|nr:phosphoribosylamine--glycine ligase [Litorivicinus sp.]MDC1208018.1 phosphoribosylamine--glycine ligase [Litorivicinus sp.]MDC1240332.1 phosphoribosylamine--glycine ligase [Litorivicinus sp.]MDC1466969.1 phosphoribosylamine--glycine ligase [Litorivicinus sp.]